MNPLGIWTIFCKLNCYFTTINNSSIQSINSLLRLISIFVPHKSKTTGVPRPSISRYENIDDLAVLVKKRKQIISSSTEGYVEDEKRVSVGDIWRS